MKSMDRELLIAYRDRWRAVEEVEREENRAATVALRWQQMNAIFRLAIGLGLLPNQHDGQKQAVYRRWAVIKRCYESIE